MSCARVHYLKGFDAVGVVVVGLLSNVIILWGPSRAPVYVAGLVLTCLLPGYLLTRTMLSADEGIDQVERVVLAGGMGFAVLVVITLGLHFIPGPLNVKLVLVAFDGLLLLLGAVLAGQRRLASPSDVGRTATVAPASRYGLFILLVLVLSAAFFRLANLGYSEFQGDEARAMLMAAGVIRGEEQILFLHRKGPVEILMPAAFYALGGTTDELVARLPFAVASLGGILCVYCLVKRLFPHREIAAPMAAGLLAVDGYLIAFGRIVQYQSVVFLMMALAVWCAYVWYSSGKSVLLWLTAAFLAVGTLAHYETVVVAPVLIWLFCSRACREGWPLRRWIRRALGPGLLAVVVVGAFYVPFVCHPRFIPTAQYLTGERLGTAGLYNNLGDFFWRATFYNSTYYIAFLCVGLVALVIRELSSSLPPVLAVLIMVTTLVGLALSAVSPSALTAGNLDLAILPAALSMAVLIGAPRVAREEKVAFLWFAVPSLIALFLTRKPKNHVYLMFPAWAVLVGVATDRFVVAVRGRAARLRWARYLWHPGVAFGCGML
ncbi:MAG: glycosyltransferase family 39 protein, partial [Anaerolineae bacterium]